MGRQRHRQASTNVMTPYSALPVECNEWVEIGRCKLEDQGKVYPKALQDCTIPVVASLPTTNHRYILLLVYCC